MKSFNIPQASLYGIKKLDEQHQEMINIVESLSEYIDSDNLAEVNKLFVSLQKMLVTHFNDEEQLMKDVGYPDVGSHSLHHQELLSVAKKIHSIVMGRGVLTSHDVDNSVDKIIRHMFLSDGPFNTHLHQIGKVSYRSPVLDPRYTHETSL